MIPADNRLTPPLEGVRIVDFTWIWAGPYGTMLLAALGADVIKIESTGPRMDITRRIRSFAEGISGPNRAGYHHQYSQGKRSIALDISHPKGKEVIYDLVKVSDVVTANYGAGALERMGFGYERLRQIKPDIIQVSMPAYGETGPRAHYRAYGPLQVALTGLCTLTGYTGEPPLYEVGIAYGDPNAGNILALAVLMALWHRQRTGQGQFVDISQWDAALGLVAEGFMDYVMNGKQPPRMGNRDLVEAPQGVFPCLGEDEWVAIACWTNEQWRGLCQAMGRRDLLEDQQLATREGRKAREDRIEEAISEWTSRQTVPAVVWALQDRGIPAYQVLPNRGVAEDPQLNGWGAFTFYEYPEIGVRQHVGTPWKFSAAPVRPPRRGPLLGEHTEEVLRQLLGYPEARIAALREARVLQ